LAFHDPDNGWVTGSVQIPGTSWLFISQDEGSNWDQQTLILPSGSQNSILAIQPPFFYPPLEGILPVRMSQVSVLTALYLTDDGGLTWEVTTPVAVSGPLDCVSAVSCRVWNGTTIASTDDGGITWQNFRTNIDLRVSLVQIDFVSPSIGFALAILNQGGSALYKTTDGGRNWSPLW
jgi:photosystem II stability/assembly factor-like uncharacterized protein